MTEEPKVEEEDTQIAPGLALAHAPEDQDDGFRRRGPDPLAALRSWQPRTRLGRMVMNGEILTYEQALATGYPIREVEIVDALLPEMEDDVLSVNMIQRMTDSGRRVRFNVLCAVGNSSLQGPSGPVARCWPLRGQRLIFKELTPWMLVDLSMP